MRGTTTDSIWKRATAWLSREAQIVSEQAEKATRVHPYEPTRAEKLVQRLEHSFLVQPVGVPVRPRLCAPYRADITSP